MLKYFGFCVLFCLSLPMFAQRVDYHLKFKAIGDNREYFSGYNEPQTILGTRGAFTLGARLDSMQQVRAGLDYFYEFGSELGELKPEFILYYQVQYKDWGFRFGSFDRTEVLDYPLAFIADDYNYYKPNLEGLYIQYTPKNHRVNAFADWVSRQDTVRREQFMAGITGTHRWGNILLEEYWYMFHNAGRAVWTETEPIEDYMGGLVLAGCDFSDKLNLDIATVKTGALASQGRTRGSGLGFEKAISSYSEIALEKRGFGVKSVFNFGQKHHFFVGDAFYNNTTSYVRTNLYFTPINLNHIKGRFIWSLHVANGDLDNQQQFSLIYEFGQKLK